MNGSLRKQNGSFKFKEPAFSKLQIKEVNIAARLLKFDVVQKHFLAITGHCVLPSKNTKISGQMYVNTPNKHQFSFDCTLLLHFFCVSRRKKKLYGLLWFTQLNIHAKMFSKFHPDGKQTPHMNFYTNYPPAHTCTIHPHIAGLLQTQQEFRKSDTCV